MQLPSIIVSALALINLAPDKPAEFGDEWKAIETKIFARDQEVLSFAVTHRLLQGLDEILSLRCKKEETDVKLLALKLTSLGSRRTDCDFDLFEQMVSTIEQLYDKLELFSSSKILTSDQSKSKSNAILYLEHFQDEQVKLCQQALSTNLEAAIAATSRGDRDGLKLLVEKLGYLEESPPPQTLSQRVADFFVARINNSKLLKNLSSKKSAVRFEEEFDSHVGGLCNRVKTNFRAFLDMHERLKRLAPTNLQDWHDDWIKDVNTCLVVDANIPSIKDEVYKCIMSKYSGSSLFSAIKRRF